MAILSCIIPAVLSLGVGGFVLVDYEGRAISGEQEGLLLHYNGTVAPASFDMNAAEAICMVMGFYGATSWSHGHKWTIQNNYSIAFDRIHCTCVYWHCCSKNVRNTHYSGNYDYEYDDGYRDNVFLTCNGTRKTPFSLVNDGGIFHQISGAGIVFTLLYNDGAVCSGDWDSNNMTVAAICRSMGYDDIAVKGSSVNLINPVTKANLHVALSEVNCTSDDWSSCTVTESQGCKSGRIVTMTCKSGHGNESSCNATTTSSLIGDPEKLDIIDFVIAVLVAILALYVTRSRIAQQNRNDAQIELENNETEREDEGGPVKEQSSARDSSQSGDLLFPD